MKASLLRYRVLRGLAALQISAALALGLALFHSHSAYKTSIASILPAATISLSATAEVLSEVAKDVEDNRVILESLTTALGSYTNLVAQSKTSTEQMADLLPVWHRTVLDASKRARDISNLMNATADKMEFRVPTGLEFEGMKPRITWSVPLRSRAQDLRQLAAETHALGGNIDNTWDVLSTNGTAMSQAFVTTCDTTARLLNETRDAVAKLTKEDVGPATARLNDASAGLRAVAAGVNQTNLFVDSLFYLGLALATSVGLSGLGVLLMAADHTAISLQLPNPTRQLGAESNHQAGSPFQMTGTE